MNNILQKALNKSKGPLSIAVINQANCLSSSSINNTWRLKLKTGEELFAKITCKEDFSKLKYEASGLDSLRKFNDPNLIEIPQPLVLTCVENHAILILPWLNFGIGDQRILGKGLALLHQASTTSHPNQFGWEVDGFIGAGNQQGGWRKSWGECFTNLRLLPQLKTAKKWGLNSNDWKTLLNQIIVFLDKDKPSPVLVHGDLWSGNFSIQKNGKAVIFDPAIWWADREVDLAMTKLFGGFSNEFYSGYEETWPLKESASSRIEIYNLYHILNHANIFGGYYKSQALSSLKNLENHLNTSKI